MEQVVSSRDPVIKDLRIRRTEIPTLKAARVERQGCLRYTGRLTVAFRRSVGRRDCHFSILFVCLDTGCSDGGPFREHCIEIRAL